MYLGITCVRSKLTISTGAGTWNKETYASSLESSRPKGAGNSIGGPASIETVLLFPATGLRPRAAGLLATAHFAPHSNSAVWSSFAARSKKWTSAEVLCSLGMTTRGLISR